MIESFTSPRYSENKVDQNAFAHQHGEFFHNFRNFVAFVAFNGTQMYDKTNWKRPLCVDFVFFLFRLILLIFRRRRCWRCASRCVLIGRFSRNCWWRCCCCHFKASVSQLHGNGIQMNAYFMRLTRTLIDMFAFTLFFFVLCFWSSLLGVNVCVGKTCRYWN